MDESLFDGIHFDRPLEDDDDDDIYGSRGSEFETESLGSSSTDEDEQIWPVMAPQRQLRKRRHVSTSEESSTDVDTEEIPMWFHHGPFKYNSRVAVLALPGFVLALLFAGELLLSIITVGTLIVYVLYNNGNRQKALLAYLILFIIVQLTVVYSVLPLIWKSLLNVVIVLALNVYTLLTGGWITLLFQHIRFRDIELLLAIETSLFSIYPIVFVVQLTWIVSVMTSVMVAPYVFVVLGFVVLHVFLTPVPSSFVRPHAQGSLAVWDCEGLVLSPLSSALVVLSYVVAGPVIVVVLQVSSSWSALVSLVTWVQLLFITSSSVFLASFLHLRLFVDLTGIPQRALLIVRWSAAVTSLALIGPLLSCYNIQSTLLPWTPLVVVVYIGLVLALLRKSKVLTHVSLVSLTVTCILLFYQLPWRLNYDLLPGVISMSAVAFLILVNSMLCIVAIYAALYWSSDVLGACLLLQSTVFIISSSLLLAAQNMSIILILLSTVFYCYMSLRLYHSSTLPRRPSIILCSLHISSFISALGRLYGPAASSNSLLINLYDFAATMMLVVCLVISMVYEERTDLDNRSLINYVVAVATSLMLNLPILLSNVLHVLTTATDSDVSVFSSYLGVILLVTSLVYLKLVCFHGVSVTHKFSLFALLCLPAVVLMTLQPHLSLDRVDVQKWSAVLGVASVTAVLPLSSVCHASLHIIGAAIIFPAGLFILHALFPGCPSLLVQSSIAVLATLCSVLLLVTWYQPRNTDQWIRKLSIAVGVCSTGLCVTSMSLSTDNSDVVSWPPVVSTASFTALILVSVVIRLRDCFVYQQGLEPSQRDSSLVQSILLLGNIYSLISFLLIVVNCPPILADVWYIWVCVGSSPLLLHNIDSWLMLHVRPSSRCAPTVTVSTVALYMAALLDCVVFDAHGFLDWMFGLLELTALCCSLPVAACLSAMVWRRHSLRLDICVVFTAPLYVILFITGETYSSWALASCGLAASYWLIKYRLKYDQCR